MSKDSIKKGTLVKAWDDDIGDYNIYIFYTYCDIDGEFNPKNIGKNYGCFNDHGTLSWFKNAIPIPDSLANQLERLGSNKCTNKAGEFNCGDVEQGIGVMLCDECGR